MKKILIMVLLLSAAFSMKVEIHADGCAGWKDWSNKTGKVIVTPGGIFEVDRVYHPWVKIKVLSGPLKGKVGYCGADWIQMDVGKVIHPGVNFRSSAEINSSNKIGTLFPGVKVQVLERIPNRYLIIWNDTYGVDLYGGKWNKVWIWHRRAKVMK